MTTAQDRNEQAIADLLKAQQATNARQEQAEAELQEIRDLVRERAAAQQTAAARLNDCVTAVKELTAAQEKTDAQIRENNAAIDRQAGTERHPSRTCIKEQQADAARQNRRNEAFRKTATKSTENSTMPSATVL